MSISHSPLTFPAQSYTFRSTHSPTLSMHTTHTTPHSAAKVYDALYQTVRYIAVPPNLTYPEAVEWVTPSLTMPERVVDILDVVSD